MDSINHMFDGGVEEDDALAPSSGVGLPGPLGSAGAGAALGDDALHAGGLAAPTSSFGASDGFGSASAGAVASADAGAAPAAGGAGAAPSAAAAGGAPPAISTGAGAAAAAPVPVFRPILRGKLYETPSASGAGSGVTYAWVGRWAMSESDSVWGDFQYTMRISGQQAVPLPPAHVMPLNPRMPSAVEHPPVAGPMVGHFMMLAPDGKTWNGIKDKVTFRIGGPLPPEAPTSVSTQDGVAVGAGALVGITGDGALPNAVRYELRGAYHPASGTAWVIKVMTSTPGTPKPRPPPGERKPRAAPGAGGAGGAPKAVRSLEDGLSASAAALPASRGASLRGVAGGSGSKAFQRECEMLLTALRRDRVNSPFFLEPVDPVKHCCPDYFDKIATPMDLSTVATKLKDGAYNSDRAAFAADVRLVFDNAMAYNPPAHPVHVAAGVMKRAFETLLSQREAAAREAEEAKRLALTDERAGRKSAGVGGKRDRPSADSDDEDEDEEEEDERSSSAAAAAVKKPRKAPSSSGGGSSRSSGPAGAGHDGGGSESERMLRLQREIEGLQAQVGMMVECTRKVLAINAGAVIGGMSGVVPQELQGLLGGGGGSGGGGSSGGARRRRVDDDDDDEDYRVEKPSKPKPAKPAAPKAPAAPKPAAAASSSSSGAGSSAAAASRGGTRSAGPSAASAAPEPIAIAVPLTKSEQLALSAAVESLSEPQMEQLLQLVQERMRLDPAAAAAAAGGGEAELELDIEAMDTATLRELQRFVSRATGTPLPAAAKEFFDAARASSAAGAGSAGAGGHFAGGLPPASRGGAGGPGAAAPRPMAAAAAAAPAPTGGLIAGLDDDDDLAPPPR